MRESGTVGIAKIILRDTQHLAAVEVIDDALVLTMMRLGADVVDLMTRLRASLEQKGSKKESGRARKSTKRRVA